MNSHFSDLKRPGLPGREIRRGRKRLFSCHAAGPGLSRRCVRLHTGGRHLTETSRREIVDDPTVVSTKLHIPAPPLDRVPRPELLSLVSGAARARLILVSAPAGSGKTTLLASWHALPEEQRSFAWVSLDPEDNDSVRFWRYVLAALRSVHAGFGADVVAALRAPGADVVELAMPMIVNELARLPEPIVLVLDDYHAIANRDVHRSVEFLLDHLPPTTQVAVASRSDPALPLPRLRARGELVEVRAVDLRLTDAQAAALLNGSLGLELAPSEIAQLRERTEGWAAGLQLVGLSLRGRDDRREYIDSFAGDDRQIVDYLAIEVLDRQTPEKQAFLLKTSVLERLSGPLCDAVTGEEGSARMLDTLERENLFVVPLDTRREWYRYHHLFRDLLRHELVRAEPGNVEDLHRRASGWFRAAGLFPEAIRHATEAGDVATASELIAANWLTFVNRGELETVEAWTRALPPGAAEADPRLCIARAWMLLVLGRPEEVEQQVRAAERGTLPGAMQDGSRSVEASAALVRTSAQLLLGDVGGATRTSVLAAELETDPEARWWPFVTNALGMTAYWGGRTEAAVDAFRQTVAAAERVGNHTARIYGLGYLAVIAAESGGLDEADRHVRAMLGLARDNDLMEHWVATMGHFAAGEIARGRGDLAGADAAIERGLELATRGGLRLDAAYGRLAQARLRRQEGQTTEAREVLERARRDIGLCADPGILAELEERTARTRSGAASGPTVIAGPRPEELSERELAVLRLLPTDLSLRDIGRELYVSVNTVKTHVRRIYAKLGVTSRVDAVARARELDVL